MDSPNLLLLKWLAEKNNTEIANQKQYQQSARVCFFFSFSDIIAEI